MIILRMLTAEKIAELVTFEATQYRERSNTQNAADGANTAKIIDLQGAKARPLNA